MPVDVPLPARLDLVPVGDVMHAGVLGCTADTPLVEVARKLAAERVHCLVVSDVERTSTGQRLRWATIDVRAVVRALAAFDGGTTAGALATAPAATVTPADTVAEALAVLVAADVEHLVVEERGFPVGILSALDVARVAGGA